MFFHVLSFSFIFFHHFLSFSFIIFFYFLSFYFIFFVFVGCSKSDFFEPQFLGPPRVVTPLGPLSLFFLLFFLPVFFFSFLFISSLF